MEKISRKTMGFFLVGGFLAFVVLLHLITRPAVSGRVAPVPFLISFLLVIGITSYLFSWAHALTLTVAAALVTQLVLAPDLPGMNLLTGNPTVIARLFFFTVANLAIIWMIHTLKREIADRKAVAEALRRSEQKYRRVIETAQEGIWMTNAEGRITLANERMAEMMGCRATEMVGKPMSDFMDDEATVLAKSHLQGGKHGVRGTRELRLRRLDAGELWAGLATNPILDEDGRFIGTLAMVTDIGPRKRAEQEKEKLEDELREAQKMEALGVLAGGIAHDFNNILTPILGHAYLLQEEFPENSPQRANVEQVLEAGHRAKDLVQQILAFSRRGGRHFQAVEISEVVKEATKLLRASLPATITLRESISSPCGTVMADPSQIHQVVMNLGANAYQAMRGVGGKLEVSLEPIEFDGRSLTEDGMPGAGSYVRLTVADAGMGIAPALRERVFEPFFTTKERGEGTGLGLSVVHGIVAGHGGTIDFSSEPGKGTSFFVYLPCWKGGAVDDGRSLEVAPTGRERILLVDDEESVVRVEQKMLERFGYDVTVRTSSREALRAFLAAPQYFDLLLADLTMPDLTGVELAQKVTEVRPGIPIILATGFHHAIDAGHAEASGIREVVRKPFDASELAAAVRRVLDQPDLQGRRLSAQL